MTPYVEVRNSHDPTKAQLNSSKTAKAVTKMVVNLKVDGAYTKFDNHVMYLRSSGDLSKAMLMEEVIMQDTGSDNLPWPIQPLQLLKILPLDSSKARKYLVQHEQHWPILRDWRSYWTISPNRLPMSKD
jgi:hypothetical protein